MTQTISCNKCGLVDDFRTEVKANNQVAYCNGCNTYIKNISYQEPKLYVGKYKGHLISAIDDLNYLKWASGTLKLSANIKQAIDKQISQLEFLAK